uniref:Uncharacterized protein n=1 Tax=Oryza brachyantha TaxID=4533 RepID=J3LE92_ORYBR
KKRCLPEECHWNRRSSRAHRTPSPRRGRIWRGGAPGVLGVPREPRRWPESVGEGGAVAGGVADDDEDLGCHPHGRWSPPPPRMIGERRGKR